MTQMMTHPAPRKQTWKHLDVFESYFLLGPGRTLKELSTMTGIPVGTLRSWSKDFKWQNQLSLRDREAQLEVKKVNSAVYIEQVKARHMKFYQQAQAKAMKQLNRKRDLFRDDKDAAIALDIGIKGEREVLGLRDTKIKAAMVKEGFAAFMEAVIGPND